MLVEPYLAGTAAAQISDALADVPHRLLAHGVRVVDLHRFGTAADHDRAHGLDLESLRTASPNRSVLADDPLEWVSCYHKPGSEVRR